jgi:hypothetical protein
MSDQLIYYQSVLAEMRARLEALEAERAGLMAAIAPLETMIRSLSSSAYAKGAASPGEPNSSIYKDMTIGDAAVHFLRFSSIHKKTREIAAGLIQGGIGSDSKNMYRAVYNALTLRAAREDSDVIKHGNEWEFRPKSSPIAPAQP